MQKRQTIYSLYAHQSEAKNEPEKETLQNFYQLYFLHIRFEV